MRLNMQIGNVGIKFDTKRIDRNLKEAQKILNMAVKIDSEPLVPHLNGGLRGSVNFPEGIYGGVLEYNTPYAHYLYEGIVYGPNIPRYDDEGHIVGWYSPKDKKKHPTGKKLTYHEPGTTDHWFAKSKEKNLQKWIRLVKDEAGKG